MTAGTLSVSFTPASQRLEQSLAFRMLRKYFLVEGIKERGLELPGGSERSIWGALFRGDRSGQRSEDLSVLPRKYRWEWRGMLPLGWVWCSHHPLRPQQGHHARQRAGGHSGPDQSQAPWDVRVHLGDQRGDRLMRVLGAKRSACALRKTTLRFHCPLPGGSCHRAGDQPVSSLLPTHSPTAHIP